MKEIEEYFFKADLFPCWLYRGGKRGVVDAGFHGNWKAFRKPLRRDTPEL